MTPADSGRRRLGSVAEPLLVRVGVLGVGVENFVLGGGMGHGAPSNPSKVVTKAASSRRPLTSSTLRISKE